MPVSSEQGMVDMELRPLDEPAPPADPNQVVEFELWKMARRNYEKQAEARRRNSSRVYALIIGQCSQALRNRMEASEEWECINDESNVMDLLQLIQKCMTQRQTRQKPVHTLMDAEAQVFSFRQKNLADNEYYDKFKDLVSIAERLGSNIGAQADRVNAILQEIAADPDIPTEPERRQAREQAKDEYLAVMFLVNSDRQCYGSLVRDIENEYTRGADTYPMTLSTAYDYIVNYRPAKSSSNVDEGGLAFYTRDGDDSSGRGCGGGRGRGSGRGQNTGRGRGGRGRGSARRAMRSPTKIICMDRTKQTMMTLSFWSIT